MILAGGEGTRLQPLTVTRSKPAVPFAGSYRLIDFVLNNFVNSDIIRIFVLTQQEEEGHHHQFMVGREGTWWEGRGLLCPQPSPGWTSGPSLRA